MKAKREAQAKDKNNGTGVEDHQNETTDLLAAEEDEDVIF